MRAKPEINVCHFEKIQLPSTSQFLRVLSKHSIYSKHFCIFSLAHHLENSHFAHSIPILLFQAAKLK